MSSFIARIVSDPLFVLLSLCLLHLDVIPRGFSGLAKHCSWQTNIGDGLEGQGQISYDILCLNADKNLDDEEASIQKREILCWCSVRPDHYQAGFGE